MVLQSAHRPAHAPQARLDTSRILGISGTLALNLLALLALLIPMQLPAPIAQDDAPPELIWIDTHKPEPAPQPERVEIVRPRTVPQPAARTPAIVQQPVEPILFEQGELAAEPMINMPPGDMAPPSGGSSGPLSGMALEYASAPAPAYPREAIRRGLEGTVLLEVLVDVDGRPLDVTIHRSSGHALLDREAQRHVLRRWSFRPAMKDGRAVQAIGIVPIDFTLGR